MAKQKSGGKKSTGGTVGGGGSWSPNMGLPWNSASNMQFDARNPEDIQNAYNQAYANSVNMSSQQYNNIQSALGQILARYQAGGKGLMKGYKTLKDNVLSRIEGVGLSDLQGIKDLFAQKEGTALQYLTTGGFAGGSPASDAIRGLALDRAKAETGSRDATSENYASAQSALGQSQLNARQSILNAVRDLALGRVNHADSLEIGYPDPGPYMQMIQDMNAKKAAEDMMSQAIYGARATTGFYPGSWDDPLTFGNKASWMMGKLAEGGAFNSQGPIGGPSPSTGGKPGGIKVPQQQGGGWDAMDSVGAGMNSIWPGSGDMMLGGYNILAPYAATQVGLNSIYPGLGSLFGGAVNSMNSSYGGTNIGLGGYAPTGGMTGSSSGGGGFWGNLANLYTSGV